LCGNSIPCKAFFMQLETRSSRLCDYLDGITALLANKTRASTFAAYFVGLLSSLQRKTAESIATLFSDHESIGATHQRLVHLLAGSPWKDEPIRRYSVDYAMMALPEDDPVLYWIVDDTGFVKKGSHSVGVQRQYTGTSGKVDNCQLGVSLAVATFQRQLPLDFELYLGKAWLDDEVRRKEARIPDDIHFRTKPEIAAAMICRAVKAGYPQGVVLADHAYGNNASFRQVLSTLDLDFSVDIGGSTRMWRLDSDDKRRGPTTSAESLGRRLPYRRITWAEGTQRQLASRFAFARVVIRGDTQATGKVRPVWLVAEDPYDEAEGKKYFITTLPGTSPHVALVHTHMNRWRTERMYQDMKGVFGLDHYEGRRYVGWNHHVTIAMAAYAFSFAEQARLFPPQADRPAVRGTISSTTRTPLRRFDDFDGTAVLWGTARMVAGMSGVPPGPF
jgi:SRSO17 transposase